MIRAKRASCLNTDDSWMYEDGADEIVFSVDQECQLLGIGLCGTEGAFTAEVDVREVGLCSSCAPYISLISLLMYISCAPHAFSMSLLMCSP